MNTAGLTVSTTSSNGLRNLPRSMTGANSLTSPTSPATAAAMSLASSGLLSTAGQPIVLTPSQFAIECGGVLLDPATNEVCLLFYPDTSEWRLPMGKPDTMSAANCSIGSAQQKPPVAAEPSTAGCEPTAHAAQRQISHVTGYRCSHLHPEVSAHATESPCAYMGPQMVEPLALQIEQRTVTASSGSPRISSDAFDLGTTDFFADNTDSGAQADAQPQQTQDSSNAQDETGASNALGLTATESDSGYHSRIITSQFVMTYYYMAWLTQNRFEPKAATHPVGPAQPSGMLNDSTFNRLQQPAPRTMPMAEVTWFKVDTAAQVLTNSSDKVALREVVNRLTRLGAPELPFAYSAALVAQKQQPALSNPMDKQTKPLQAPADGPNEATADLASSASSGASALSDNATKADNASASAGRTLLPASRNLDIIRRTATSFSKRGGSIFKKSSAASSESTDGDATPDDRQLTTINAGSTPGPAVNAVTQPIIVPKRNNMPRVFSIFYKLVGSSSA
ncbi:hypothetical protein IWW50_000197 [Coemansia erecta]|nr:hypothetical protein GGF43_000399 [Coemansia sp. RSA 2618]KAJ2830566.1 hypothetical protein IWW50_000197 [Coemansia erecta]